MGAEENVMFTRFMLALALVLAIAALSVLPASAGPDDRGQTAQSSDDSVATTGGVGGNLVTLW